ncbi:nucleoside hydrolase [Microbacterium esteraromaticum]|uniref:Nucleoside hydrolase n=1 Tax=Microbacterium esteraromaticum TaxID=57043 RepID=A0A7D7W7N7_9MICO|nr:nucleoside hydrolase [Microbacterium esteraromaticum]QMU97116.1 nucleoside hydrolase [Microbacterium esteraromaticum]
MTVTRVWLDCDTGSDDAVAIMAAALHPDLDLVGVSCVNGNVTLDHVVDNTLRVLSHIGVDVPVHRGAVRPLMRPDFPVPRHILNPEGSAFHADTLPLPASPLRESQTGAAQAIVDAFMADGGDEIVLVPTGPLTNIALALAIEPRLASRISRVVLMGGARGQGNVSGSAEFNIWVDPEAAEAVLSAGIRDVLILPLDATHSAPISLTDCERYEQLGTPAGRASADLIRHRIVGYDDREDTGDAAPVHDALCLAAIVRPEVLTHVVEAAVHVETRGELTIGATIVDDRPWRDEPANARFALAADRALFASFLAEAFQP